MKKLLLPILVFTLATSIALYNIGNFPKMIGDEGIYVAQAYWLTHIGRLGPYTYWYDHFPLGWLQIGAWQLLVGPLRFFGHTVLSARVFMGIILGGTTTLLYLLTHKLAQSKLTAFLAATIFITSALTLTFGRMVLLDNLAVFWFLFSLFLLFTHPKSLRYLAFSALSLALAILSKESLLFLLPPYLFSVYFLNKSNPHLKFALLVNYLTILFLLSFFPLLAILKGELLPQSNQVSFLGTLLFQASRGSGLPFWAIGSHFHQMLSVWLNIDPILIVLGTIAFILIPFLTLPFSHKIISFFTLFFVLFLIRGGQIYDFYLIPLLPLLALNISLLLQFFRHLTKIKALIPLFLGSIIIYSFTNSSYPFTTQVTLAQTQAVNSLKSLPASSVIVAPDYAYLDTYLSNPNRIIYWYRKAESDPSINQSLGSITHFLVDEQFARELAGPELPLLLSELKKQSVLTKYGKLLSPGEIIKPYTSEFLTLYQKNNQTQSLEYIVTIDKNNLAQLNLLKAYPPYGVLVTRDNFTNSADLESYLSLLQSKLSPQTLIMVSQDDTGDNTIPWVTTPSRQFYKSAGEASLATAKKTQALKAMGITSAIITDTTNSDGYLGAIVESANAYLVPVLRYNNEILSLPSIIFVTNKVDLDLLTQQNYSGKIALLVGITQYLTEK